MIVKTVATATDYSAFYGQLAAANTWTAGNNFAGTITLNSGSAATATVLTINQAVNSYTNFNFPAVSGSTFPNNISWSRNNSAGYAFQIYNNTSSTNEFYVTDSGNVFANGTITSSSSRELKENIYDLSNLSSIVKKVMELQPVSFNYKDSGTPSLGFIAEDIQPIFPELISKNESLLALNYNGLIAPLVSVVQSQQKKILQLEAYIKEIFGRLA